MAESTYRNFEPEGSGGTPGGTTGQVQVNSAGAFAGISEATAGFVLTSGGAGISPTFQAPTSDSVLSVNGETGVVVLDAADVGAAGTSANTYTGSQQIDATEPRFLFNATGGGADGKLFDIDVTPTLISLRTRTDADGAGRTFLSATRTAASIAITNISLGDATGNPTYSFLGSGLATFYGAATIVSNLQSNANVQSVAGTPAFRWDETDQGADLKWWSASVSGAVWSLSTLTDSTTAGNNAIAVTRGATTSISNIAFGNATNNPSYSFLGTGSAGFAGGLSVTGGNMSMVLSNPIFRLVESDAGTDLKRWQMNINGSALIWQTITDANGAGKDFYTVNRGATTAVASIVYGNATDAPTHTFQGQVIQTTNILAQTSAAYTDGAGAGAGTMTNSPSVGNPTKWIPIKDNGTTRYIPAW